MTLIPMLQHAFEGEPSYERRIFDHHVRLMIEQRYAGVERALVNAIETGVRYVRVPLITGGQIVFDTHELDGDATGVK